MNIDVGFHVNMRRCTLEGAVRSSGHCESWAHGTVSDIHLHFEDCIFRHGPTEGCLRASDNYIAGATVLLAEGVRILRCQFENNGCAVATYAASEILATTFKDNDCAIATSGIHPTNISGCTFSGNDIDIDLARYRFNRGSNISAALEGPSKVNVQGGSVNLSVEKQEGCLLNYG